MSEKQIATRLYKNYGKNKGMTNDACKEITSEIITILSDLLANEGWFNLQKIGTFKKICRKKYTHTGFDGKKYNMPEKHIVYMSMSPALTHRLNRGKEKQ